MLDSLFSGENVVGFDGDGDESSFDVEVSGELLERNLSFRSHNDVGSRLVNVLAESLMYNEEGKYQ